MNKAVRKRIKLWSLYTKSLWCRHSMATGAVLVSTDDLGYLERDRPECCRFLVSWEKCFQQIQPVNSVRHLILKNCTNSNIKKKKQIWKDCDCIFSRANPQRAAEFPATSIKIRIKTGIPDPKSKNFISENVFCKKNTLKLTDLMHWSLISNLPYSLKFSMELFHQWILCYHHHLLDPIPAIIMSGNDWFVTFRKKSWELRYLNSECQVSKF